MKSWVREPLLHFLLIGAGLFVLYSWGQGRSAKSTGRDLSSSTEIVISQDELQQMTEDFERSWQREATEADRKILVESVVRDEIYYREARAAGLDRDDGQIRRRLRLQMEAALADMASLAPPTDEELLRYLEEHPEKYGADTEFTFRQIYLEPEREGELSSVLAQLEDGADPQGLSDPFPGGLEFESVPLGKIRRQFGVGFANEFLELEPSHWAGPLHSNLGLHCVLVERRDEAPTPPLEEVREAVQRDWTTEKQQEREDAAYARLRPRYTVVIEAAPDATRSVEETSSR